jgi:predicted nucleic acid-binding protein
MRFLLDTNICIYLIKRRPESVLARFNELSAGDIGISSVTVYEMAYGAEKSDNTAKSLQALQHFLSPLDILPLTSKMRMKLEIYAPTSHKPDSPSVRMMYKLPRKPDVAI